MGLSTVGQLKKISAGDMVEPDDEMLRRLQLVILGIADDIDSYCVDNHIDYALGGGSVLGAIRHHGFIPWDDDMDIDMPRQDYDRFVKGFPEAFPDKYCVQCPELTPELGLPMMRVRLRGSVVRTHEDKDNPDAGAFVDIFVVENTHNNSLRRYLQGLHAMWDGLMYSCRRFYRDRDFYVSFFAGNSAFVRTVKIKALIGHLLAWRHTMEEWSEIIVRCYSSCKDSGSTLVSVPAGRGHFFGEIYPRDEFVATRRVPFEGRMFNVPKAAEKYLDHHYGDWHAIPSDGEREHHAFLELDLEDAPLAVVPCDSAKERK